MADHSTPEGSSEMVAQIEECVRDRMRELKVK